MGVTETLLLFFLMSVVTYITRRTLLRVPSDFFSSRMKNGLSFIPIGILAGLIFPSLFLQNKEFVINPIYLVASILCLLLMKLSKNVFLSFGVSVAGVVLINLLVN
ncbi:AzlD domain-containing protein [Bacillus salitolerans]|uniref:AzlD domain-containing protein n=1 Tax=Bacillus salitolerans TaxID=1437434 RepID=A0ABW4LX22_9BACI